MVALLVLLTIILLLTADWIVQRREARKTVTAAAPPLGLAAAPEPTRPVVPLDRLPAGVFIGEGHAWVQIHPSGTVRLGADRFAPTLLGGIDALRIRPVGTEIHRGDPIATLRRGSREVTLRSPVDGVVTEINEDIRDRPHRLRDDAFGGGWLCWIRPDRLSDAVKGLRIGEDAVDWTRRELRRLGEFLAAAAVPVPTPVGATLQDGGPPLEGVASALADDRWVELENGFFRPERVEDPNRGAR